MSPERTTSPPSPSGWWVVAAIWLVFLVYPVLAVFDADRPVWAKVVALILIATFAVVYGLAFAERLRGFTAYALLLALAAGTVPVIGAQTTGMVPFLCVGAILLLPPPWWKVLGAASALLPLVAVLGDSDFPSIYFLLLVWPLSAGMAVLRIVTSAEERADANRATLALVSERERVARDVHDVLGHSLTVLSIKAELASRLIDDDPDGARRELEQIQQIARQALGDVRATVGGLRASNLATELVAAPRVLADAGVEVSVVGGVDEVDPAHRILLGWVLREAVTNIVRHAHAGRVEITAVSNTLRITDDGTGIQGAEGNGLRGMRERVAQAGGTLVLTSGTPGTTVEVVLG